MPDIPDSARRHLVRIRIERFYEDVNALAGSLRGGKITLGMWEEEMKLLIRQLHTGAATIAKGDWDLMTSSEWGKLGPILKEQYGYLHRFAQDILANAQDISETKIAWRARLYGDKAAFSANVIEAGDFAALLPYMPKDGSTICLNNCLCVWTMSEGEAMDGLKMITAKWTLSAAEHCNTCIGRDGFIVQASVPAEWKVPEVIGRF